MIGRVAMVPATLRQGAARCRLVARNAGAVAGRVDGSHQPEGMPEGASTQIHAAAAQLRRSAASAERQSTWLLHKAGRGVLADGPFAGTVDLLAPPLLSPWDLPDPPEEPLKVPDPGESLLDRLLDGRDYVLPEEAANTVLTLGVDPTKLLKVLKLGGQGGRRTTTAKVPGGGLGRHEARGGHTLKEHVGRTTGDLRARLRRNPGMDAASSFPNREIAEDAIAGVLTMNGRTLPHLLRGSGRGRIAVTQEFNRPVGTIVARDGTVSTTRRVTVVIVRDSSRLGYHVRTAYPSR